MSAEKKVELSRAKALAAGLGLLVLLGAVAGGTVLIEHSLHGHGDEGHHDDHAKHGHGKPKQADEHGHGKHAGEHAEGRIKLSPEAIKNASLELLTAGPGKVAVTIALPGEVALNAEALAHVTPRVAGTAREVKKQLGDTVKKGDVLALLDSREFAELQRDVLTAKERLDLAESSFKREESLWKEKIGAEKDYLAARKSLAEAKIEYRSASQKLAASSGAGSGAKGGAYTLIAPIDGTIIEKHISIGEVLKDDTQAFVIADLSSIWVNVTVYAKDLARVHTGQAVRVRAEGIEQPAAGTIAYVGPVVGEQTRSAIARVVLKDPGKAWRPGLFVTADVAVDQADAPVVVAYEGVQTVDGKEVVFVEEDGAFEARPIKLGRRGRAPALNAPANAPADPPTNARPTPEAQGSELVEVLSGVSAGERYVGKNSFILKAELGKSEAGHEH